MREDRSLLKLKSILLLKSEGIVFIGKHHLIQGGATLLLSIDIRQTKTRCRQRVELAWLSLVVVLYVGEWLCNLGHTKSCRRRRGLLDEMVLLTKHCYARLSVTAKRPTHSKFEGSSYKSEKCVPLSNPNGI